MPCGRYFPLTLAVSECSHRCQSRDTDVGRLATARQQGDGVTFAFLPAKGMTAPQTVATGRRAQLRQRQGFMLCVSVAEAVHKRLGELP